MSCQQTYINTSLWHIIISYDEFKGYSRWVHKFSITTGSAFETNWGMMCWSHKLKPHFTQYRSNDSFLYHGKRPHTHNLQLNVTWTDNLRLKDICVCNKTSQIRSHYFWLTNNKGKGKGGGSRSWFQAYLMTFQLLLSWSLEMAPLLQIERSIIAAKRLHFLSANDYCWVDSGICKGLFFQRIAEAQWNHLFNLAPCLDSNPWSSDHKHYTLPNCATYLTLILDLTSKVMIKQLIGEKHLQ